MNKPLKFQTPDNNQIPLPKSMIEGKLKGDQWDEIKTIELYEVLSSLTKEEAEEVKLALDKVKYEDLTENKYIVNEDVDEIYMEISDFFTSRGAVEIIDRMPYNEEFLQVRFEIDKPFIMTDSDFDMFEKAAFIYGNNFRIFIYNGKIVIEFKLHGYYNKQKMRGK